METTLHFPGHTVWSLAVVSLLTVAGFAVFWWRLRPGRGRRLVAGLRLAALGGVLLGYLQPAMRVEEVLRARSPVLVLVDESASMEARSPDGRRRSERVAEFFRQNAGWFDDLEQRHDVHWFACSDHARPVDRGSLLAPLPSRGAATDIETCLWDAVASSRDVAGVVIVTDGADAGRTGPRREEHPATVGPAVPLRVLLASGPEEPFSDIAVAVVGGGEFTLARNLAEVRARIESAGVGSRTVAATLSLDGEVVDTKEVVLPPHDGAVEVPLFFLPREPGRHVLEVAVSALDGEASDANNQVDVAITVARDRLRVLHVAGHPSWDERFLRETLRRRHGVEMVSFHTLRDPDVAADLPDDEGTLLIPFPAEEIFVRSVESFDLVVLQDYELPEADRERFAGSLERYVRGGGGLLFFGGSFTLGVQGPWPGHLAALLPVLEPRGPRRGIMGGRFGAAVPVRARAHPVFARRDGSRSLVERIQAAPPLPAIVALERVARGAEVLVEAVGQEEVPGEVAGDEGRWPLVVVSGHGKGAVGLVATDTLWRWAFDAGAARVYDDLVGGLVAFVTKEPEAALVRARVERDRVARGQVFGVEALAGEGGADVTARIEREVGPGVFETTGIEGNARTDEGGRAMFRFVADAIGVHRVVVTARVGGEERTGSDVFVVAPDPAEMLQVRATGRIAQALARRYGGEVHPLSDPALDRFQPRGESSVRTGARAEFPIWDHPSVLLLILTALGLEWYLERRLGQA